MNCQHGPSKQNRASANQQSPAHWPCWHVCAYLVVTDKLMFRVPLYNCLCDDFSIHQVIVLLAKGGYVQLHSHIGRFWWWSGKCSQQPQLTISSLRWIIRAKTHHHHKIVIFRKIISVDIRTKRTSGAYSPSGSWYRHIWDILSRAYTDVDLVGSTLLKGCPYIVIDEVIVIELFYWIKCLHHVKKSTK